METVKKTLATICAILFILSTVVALFAFNFDRTAFTPETYQTAFAKDDFYNRLPSLMAGAISSNITNQNNLPVVLQGADSTLLEGFFRNLLPPDTLKAMGDAALDSTFSYINMETDSAHLTLIPLKASLAGDAGLQSIYSLLAAQPNCTFLQITQMGIDLLSGGQLQLCNPPAELYSLITPIVQEQLRLTALAIPDEIEIIRAPLENDPRTRLRDTRFLMRFSPILPIILLFTLTILAVRSIKDWLGWWGVPLLISGGIVFVLSLVGAPLVKVILQGILAARLPSFLPPFLLDLAGNLASAMAEALLRPVLWQGLILTIMGAGMAVISYFIKNRENTPGY